MKLFQADNFSGTAAVYRPIRGDNGVFDAILSLYFKEFEITGIEQLDRVEVNSENFKISLLVHGRPEIYLLRKYKMLSDAQQIKFYLSLLLKLKKSRVLVSRPLACLKGDLVVLWQNANYALFEFVQGDYFRPLEQSFVSVAQAVAKMHLGFSGFDSETLRIIRQLSSKSGAYFNRVPAYGVEDWQQMLPAISSLALGDSTAAVLKQEIPGLIVLTEKVLLYKPKFERLPLAPIHSDLHPQNVLLKSGKVTAILDFDSIRISQQARDIAFALHRFGRQFFVGKNYPEAELRQQARKLATLFLNSYQEIRPLSQDERRLLPWLFLDEFLTKTLFVLRSVYQDGNADWKHNLAQFISFIKEINYFYDYEH